MNNMQKIDSLNEEVLSCRKCPRLVAWREQVAREKRKAYRQQEYWGRPVPGFGDVNARVFVVGLAPGAHGSNRTGRQFTGDASGDFFYPALFRAGFASQPLASSRDDGMTLTDLYTAPVCRCAPPDNKPTAMEMLTCQPYLETELELLRPKVIVALGKIAFESILRIYSNSAAAVGIARNDVKFIHGAVYPFEPVQTGGYSFSLVCSYHPSQQNTQTGRLTPQMFDQVWETVNQLIRA